MKLTQQPLEIEPHLKLVLVKQRVTRCTRIWFDCLSSSVTSDGLSYKIVLSFETTLAIHSAGMAPK